jgi:hypothetical protein
MSQKQVKYAYNGLNSKPTMLIPELAALDVGILYTGYKIDSSDTSIFVVLIDSEASYNYMLGWYDGTATDGFFIGTQGRSQYYAGIGNIFYSNGQASSTIATPHVLSFRFNRSTPKSLGLWRNGEAVTSANNWNTSDSLNLSNSLNHFGIGGRGTKNRSIHYR